MARVRLTRTSPPLPALLGLPLVLVLVLVLVLPGPAAGEYQSHVVITPQSPLLEIGTNFTATCVITGTTEITADNLYWNLSTTTIPADHYAKINASALSVTIPVVGEQPEWLFCISKEVKPYVALNKGRFIHGIILSKGYGLGTPENLTCVAHQEKTFISSLINCTWESSSPSSREAPTTYVLNIRDLSNYNCSEPTTKFHAVVKLPIFPDHTPMEVWVEARSRLGTVESAHLNEVAGYFVKTNPPVNVRVISESSFPTSLLINWTHPIAEEYLRLAYQIRFCQSGSHTWTDVPLVDTAKYIQTFRLQNLQPDSPYDIQVRCKNSREGHGHWSDWSANATASTPEDRPSSRPRVWIIIGEGESVNDRRVQVISKDPVLSQGRILGFNLTMEEQRSKENVVETVRRSEKTYTVLKTFLLPNNKSVKVSVYAFNSVGRSPEASLILSEKGQERSPVEDLSVWVSGGRLWVEWKPPQKKSPRTNMLPEYMVEWVGGGQRDWQRETRGTNRTFIKGDLDKFVRYTVSVYPLYAGRVGRAASKDEFLEQAAPLEAPNVIIRDKPGRNEVGLAWREVPERQRRGFIVGYTVFYTSGTGLHSVRLPGNATSCTLTALTGDTKYDVWINASTVIGSARGFNHSFTTLKYAQGEIEGIVVGVSLGFLFIFLMIMLLCIYKKDAIKENFWPQIPNPGESTIRDWSPDGVLKAETPKENCVLGISVLDVEDRKCVFEEEKGGLPLKGKYQSEEHSSGIGGSSCMSSPRQSVSDSDEGGDAADTTASTVQYSSVVAAASGGYKGQTPAAAAAAAAPQQAAAFFSRSESTQPLLDSEENADASLHFPPQHRSCFGADATRPQTERREEAEPLDFFPLDEDDGEPAASADHAPTGWLSPASSYMPQRGGYRPQ